MRLAGVSYLPLHEGKVPRWLFSRMVRLGKIIIDNIIDIYGEYELLDRCSDPYWFQSLGCVLGYDWHSSGVTTVLTAVIEKILDSGEYGIHIVGGKGIRSRRIPNVLSGRRFEYIRNREALIEASRLSAKIDNHLLQDGYTIYHHAILFTDDCRWTVIQQGMNINLKYARRYHIKDTLLDRDLDYITEPHECIIGDRREATVLDLTSRDSRENKRTMIDIFREGRLRRDYERLLESMRINLYKWINRGEKTIRWRVESLYMPRKIDWNTVRRIYEVQPRNIRELLLIKGVGPNIIRAASLISQIIYGDRASWRDPIKFTFTVGGKDGVPYPVNPKMYDSVIKYFRRIIDSSNLSRKERENTIKRLSRIASLNTI